MKFVVKTFKLVNTADNQRQEVNKDLYLLPLNVRQTKLNWSDCRGSCYD